MTLNRESAIDCAGAAREPEASDPDPAPGGADDVMHDGDEARVFLSERRLGATVRFTLAPRFVNATSARDVLLLNGFATVVLLGLRTYGTDGGGGGIWAALILMSVIIIGTIGWGIWALWSRTRIDVRSNHLVIVRRLLLLRWTTRIDLARVRGFRVEGSTGRGSAQRSRWRERGDSDPTGPAWSLFVVESRHRSARHARRTVAPLAWGRRRSRSRRAIITGYPRACMEELGTRLAREVRRAAGATVRVAPRRARQATTRRSARPRTNAVVWSGRVTRARKRWAAPPAPWWGRTRFDVTWDRQQVRINIRPRRFVHWANPGLWVSAGVGGVGVINSLGLDLGTRGAIPPVRLVILGWWIVFVGATIWLLVRHAHRSATVTIDPETVRLRERRTLRTVTHDWPTNEIEEIVIERARHRSHREFDDGCGHLLIAPYYAPDVVVFGMLRQTDREWICDVLRALVLGKW